MRYEDSEKRRSSEGMKSRTHKRLRKRSCSKEKCKFSEEIEEKEIKIRREMKGESADPDSVDETYL